MDRFRVSCPADIQSIKRFDSNIIVSDNDKEVWCAIYRSNNNLPSVLMRDDFFQSMKLATNPNPTITDTIISSLTVDTANDDKEGKTQFSTKPVAIGRLYQKPQSSIWILDTLRCIFKKENMDDKCDGGSEHTEAISLCIDTLFSHYLIKKAQKSSYKLQCKSTLVSSPLVESRGFVPIQNLNSDMTTHFVENYGHCMELYAGKVTENLSSMSRQNALDILSLLGQLDYEVEENEGGEEADYDPWANIKQFV